MRAFRLAVSLIRVPRLFASLFLIPLTLGLLVVAAQLLATVMFIKASSMNTQTVGEHLDSWKTSHGYIRKLLFGTRELLPQVRVCRWVIVEKDGKRYEEPPSSECAPKSLDVAIIDPHPEVLDTVPYEALFNGNTERIHICRACHPHIVIHNVAGELRTDTSSVWGMLLLQLVRINDTMGQHYIEVAKDKDRIQGLLGGVYFSAFGFRKSLAAQGMNLQVAAVLNIASLVVISLWLALKAHRKVLDYFARNGALLPMVAATGKHSFYSAIWILTLLRVGAFLLAAIPATIIVFAQMLEDQPTTSFFEGERIFPYLWIIVIALSFALATLIASIADLKQRHSFLSFFYLYAPMLLCFSGALIWGVTFLVDSEFVGYFRNITAALPVIGMAPMIISPLFQPSLWVLVVHALLTTVLILLFLKRNARWFAAHLEEL